MDDLIPRYDSKASFYGKAKIDYASVNRIKLYSYNTLVAEVDKENNKAKIYGTFSTTTLRHIKEFLKQQGFKAENKHQIIKDYKG